jgi:small subunit ribosomal protein S16
VAVRIRMTRVGRKDKAMYRLGAYDSRTRRDGRCLEILGTYDPAVDGEQGVTLKADRIKHWLSVGALPSENVAVFLKKQGITAAAVKSDK